MANRNTVLSDTEHNRYANRTAQKLIMYFDYLDSLDKWFKESGLELPLACRTNFRDAWFHFKKLYERRDYVKIVQEEYALEEHLIRAVKDAIICYYQIYIRKIERVYRYLSADMLSTWIAPEDLEEIKKNVHSVTFYTEKWDSEIKKYINPDTDMQLYLETVCYIYSRDIDAPKAAGQLQKCLHMIKNYYSKLRLNGTDIYRPSSDDAYMKECEEVFDKMMGCLEENRLERSIHILDKAIKMRENNKKSAVSLD